MEHIASHVFDASSGLCSDEFAARDLSPSKLKNKVCIIDTLLVSRLPWLEIKYSTSRPSFQRGEFRPEHAPACRVSYTASIPAK